MDGGVLSVVRRASPLVPVAERRAYGDFVRAVFTGSGGTLPRIVQRAARIDTGTAHRAVAAARVPGTGLPRDLTPGQWSTLWAGVRR